MNETYYMTRSRSYVAPMLSLIYTVELEQHADEPLHHQMESLSMEHSTEHPGTHPPVVFNAEGQTFMVQHQGNTIKIVPHASESAAPPGGDLNESEMCPVCGDKISGKTCYVSGSGAGLWVWGW